MTKTEKHETIRVSVRIRPLSAVEHAAFPGPSPVQAVGSEVRIFNPRHIGSDGSGRSSPASGRPSPRESLLSGAVRRPGTPTNLARQQAALITQQNDYQAYEFASVLPGNATEDHVYDASGCRDIVDSVCQGCNGTIFVYGQTGAGKTHTIEQMTQRVLQQLHARAAADESREYAMFVSVIELYNEVLRDLVSGKNDLQLRNPGGGIVVDGLVEKACTTPAETAALVAQAKAARVVAETRANAHSSRSHLILRIKVEAIDLGVNPVSSSLSTQQQQHPGERSVTFSLLNLVDLAGSERVDKSGSADTAGRLREALNINKSLLCLGNVVTALAQRSDGRSGRTHVPYRDSKLTRLLEDSLGGSARTALIACVTPLPDWNLEQTRATLDFAARAGRIVCKPHANVVSLGASGGSEVEALQKEVAQLRQLLAAQQQEAEALRRGIQKPLPPLIEVPDGGRYDDAAEIASPPSPSLSARLSDADVGCPSPPSRLPSIKEREGRTSLLWRLLHHRDRASSKQSTDAVPAPEESPRDDRRDALHSSASSVNADLEAGEDGDSVLNSQSKHGSTGKKRTISARRLLQSLSLSSRRSSAQHDGNSGSGQDSSSGAGGAADLASTATPLPLDVSGDTSAAQSPPGTPGRADDAGTPRAAGLRDHIIKQLVELLRHKKMEVKALKEAAAEQQTAMEALNSAHGLQEVKLRELVEGIARLSTTRQAEFAQWQQHLAQMEESLLCAQQEAATYRSEAQALQVELTELQAQHSAQEQQLRRASARALEAGRALSDAKHKHGTTLQACLTSLSSIQERLHAVEASASAQKRATGGQDHQLLDQVRALKQMLPQVQEVLQAGSTAAATIEVTPQRPEAGACMLPGTTSCRRCEATKGFLVLMQKLKDEVVVLTATLKARDTQLQTSQEATAKLKADLADARQQVQVMQERIDDLADELEMERSAATAGVHKPAELVSDDWSLPELHAQILQSWQSLALPLHHRSSFVLGTGQADPPWQSKTECQAHVAMLACLHQYFEDYPGKQQQQLALVKEEATLLSDGLAKMPKRELTSMCEHWDINAGDTKSRCRQLVERLWDPLNNPLPISQQAIQSAITSRKALQLAPPDKLADISLRLTAHMWSSASMVLQEAAMP